MLNLKLGNIKNRIEKLQEEINKAYSSSKDKEFIFHIVKESYTYLRFLVTSFKLDLYKSLNKNIDKKLPLKLYNIYLMHYLPYSNDGFTMRFYLTVDQIKRIEKKYNGNKKEALSFRTEKYASGVKCGLSRLSMFLASRERMNENFDIYIWNNWQKHKIYESPEEYTKFTEPYVGLENELRIFGIGKNQPSTMVVGAMWNGIEIFIIFDDNINHTIAEKVTGILRLAYDNLLKIFSNRYELLLFDQILWEIINLDDTSEYADIINELWNIVNSGMSNSESYFDYIEREGKDIFKTYSGKLLQLWNYFITKVNEKNFWELMNLADSEYSNFTRKVIEHAQYCNWLFPSIASGEIYNIDVLYKDKIKNRRDTWFKRKLFNDLGIDYMASHDHTHIKNLCSLAWPIVKYLKSLPINEEYLIHFITSIYLHDLGMAVYFNKAKDEIDGITPAQQASAGDMPLMEIRKHHPILTSKKLEEENNTKWRLNEPDELRNVSILSAYHSKKTPLLKSDKSPFKYLDDFKKVDYLFRGNGSMHSLEEMKEIQNCDFPYLLFVSLLRIIDCIDAKQNRSSELGIKKLEKILRQASKALEGQPLHILKHAAFINNKLIENSKLFEMEVIYGPEMFLPLAIVIHGFASVIDDMTKELEKINREGVIKEIKKELQTLGLHAYDNVTAVNINFHLWGFSKTLDEQLLGQFEKLFRVY